jgi:hypothetical protein
VHDIAVPFDEPSAQKKFAAHRLPTLAPPAQKKPYGHGAMLDAVVALSLHTKPAGHGWHGVETPTPY